MFLGKVSKRLLWQWIVLDFSFIGNAAPVPRNQFRPNMTNYFGNAFNPNGNVQSRQGPIMPTMNMYPTFQQQPQGYGQFLPNTGIGVLVSSCTMNRISYDKRRLTFLPIVFDFMRHIIIVCCECHYDSFINAIGFHFHLHSILIFSGQR